jgi:hypothetical protein
MQEKFKSEGKCLYCEKMYAKSGINRHLATHLKEKAAKGKFGKSFLVKVEPEKSFVPEPYFLSLWIDGETDMDTFDHFLRYIWLECCGHESEFEDLTIKTDDEIQNTMNNLIMGGKIEEFLQIVISFEAERKVSMSNEAKNVFRKGRILDYNYDFEDTTSLVITVMEEYPVKADSEIELLSRNEPLSIMCSVCEIIPATLICTADTHLGKTIFCPQCAEKHSKTCSDFDDYAARAVVNSPRKGKCCYTGGSIDIERDGVYQLK